MWRGRGSDGIGQISTRSTVLQQAKYSYNSRFADGIGTNPEELIAAAHASCFAMKLAFNIQTAGFTPSYINAQCEVVLCEGCITESKLMVNASVPDLTDEQFAQFVEDARQNCPVSKVLQAQIHCEAALVA
jgi:osmotically inducible protein OsmC